VAGAVSVGEWRLRPLRADEHEWAYALHRAALGEYVEATWGWEESLQRRMFADALERTPRDVVEVAGEPVGVVAAEERPDELYLGMLELLPEWQGRGLGTAILGWLRGRAAESGRALGLHVLPVNVRAIALYERCGLRVVAREPARLTMRVEARRWPSRDRT
jgi:ribosomal protein S18 acetylase RimI-like enzyme